MNTREFQKEAYDFSLHFFYHIAQLWVQLCSEGVNYKREGGNDGINTPEERVNYKREWEMIGRKE